jgi:DNA-binding winged helix-turn-helix (wHTH) protein
MATGSVSDTQLRTPSSGSLGREDNDSANYHDLRAVALAIASHDLREQLLRIIGADTAILPEVESSAVFAGGCAFLFGPFRLLPSQRLLLEDNTKVRIGSRAFDILTFLVERAGKTVSKDELIARVWPKVFVDDANLKTQVSLLRRALGDGNGRRYIVTVPGRGYNFVAPVAATEPTQVLPIDVNREAQSLPPTMANYAVNA